MEIKNLSEISILNNFSFTAFEIDESGYRAAIIQHEMDHLDGKLFIDYLSSMKRERIRKHIAELSQEKKS